MLPLAATTTPANEVGVIFDVRGGVSPKEVSLLLRFRLDG
jgi:hypothetical protein